MSDQERTRIAIAFVMALTPLNCLDYLYRNLAKFWASDKMTLENLDPPGWKEIFNFFQESELHNYFNSFVKDKLKASIKPQYISCIPKVHEDSCNPNVIQGKIGTKVVQLKRNIGQFLTQGDERVMKQELDADLELIHVMDRSIKSCPGYRVIKSLLQPNIYVIVAEHDLSVLDYLSDFICCLYGRPGKYGDESLTFNEAETPQENAEESETCATHKYPSMTKNHGNFRLKVVEGEYTDSQIIVLLGENGTGKSTFLQMLVS
ncbi:ABC transporter E family member 2-like [Salvia divinorum]|uniref:ABC transporter E family member 2-like n=1 Tax=Salvia divinorum TaxID=28513 RepID=A0ABD1HAV3_SALDI